MKFEDFWEGQRVYDTGYPHKGPMRVDLVLKTRLHLSRPGEDKLVYDKAHARRFLAPAEWQPESAAQLMADLRRMKREHWNATPERRLRRKTQLLLHRLRAGLSLRVDFVPYTEPGTIAIQYDEIYAGHYWKGRRVHPRELQ